MCQPVLPFPPLTPSCPDVRGQLERHQPDTEGLPLGAGTLLLVILILYWAGLFKTDKKITVFSTSFFQEDQDWGIVAMVLDRMFLWVFGAAAVVGSTMILTESCSLFESTEQIDAIITTIHNRSRRLI